MIYLNIFNLEIPPKVFLAKTSYKTSNDIFAEKPTVSFPAFDLSNNHIITFDSFTKDNPLSDFIDPENVMEVEFERFIESYDSAGIAVKILNRWIRGHCRKLGLIFDNRTKAYYYPKDANGEGLVNKTWKAPKKESTRSLQNQW